LKSRTASVLRMELLGRWFKRKAVSNGNGTGRLVVGGPIANMLGLPVHHTDLSRDMKGFQMTWVTSFPVGTLFAVRQRLQLPSSQFLAVNIDVTPPARRLREPHPLNKAASSSPDVSVRGMRLEADPSRQQTLASASAKTDQLDVARAIRPHTAANIEPCRPPPVLGRCTGRVPCRDYPHVRSGRNRSRER